MSSQIGRANASRFKELDSLRGIAALCVLLFHYTYGYDNALHEVSDDRFYFRYGYLGVQLFFLISGFVIFMTIEKTEKSIDFLVSRFSRLYPGYWTAVFLTVLLTTLIYSPFQQHYTTTQVLANLTMFQLYLRVKDVDSVYWTLGVELTFYAIIWIIFLSKQLRNIQFISLVWLIVCILFSVVRVPFENIIRVVLILKYAPLFIAGMMFYLLKNNKRNTFAHLIIAFSLLTEYVILYEIDNHPIVYILVTLCFGVFYLFTYDKLKFLSGRFLFLLGAMSYSLYLIHQDIGMAIIYQLTTLIDNRWVNILITILPIAIMAYAITFYVEKPAMKFIRKRMESYTGKSDSVS